MGTTSYRCNGLAPRRFSQGLARRFEVLRRRTALATAVAGVLLACHSLAYGDLLLLNGEKQYIQDGNLSGSVQLDKSAFLVFDGADQTIDNVTITGLHGSANYLQIGGPNSPAAVTLTLGANAVVQGALQFREGYYNGQAISATLINYTTLSTGMEIDNFINYGTVQSSNNNRVYLYSDSSAASFINNGNINVTGATVEVLSTSGTFTNNSAITVTQRGNFQIDNTTNLINATGGTIAADHSGLQFMNAWTNSGTISVTNGSTLYLQGSVTTGGIGHLTVSADSTVYVSGTIDNTNQTLSPGNYGGAWNLNGTIAGGRIDLSGGNLTVKPYSTLNGVTLVGADLALGSPWQPNFVQGGLAGDGHALNLNGYMVFDGGDQTLDNITINAVGEGSWNSANLFIGGANSTGLTTLTLGAGAILHGALSIQDQYQSGITGKLINNGLIDADAAPIYGRSAAIAVDTFINNGTVQVRNGSVLAINGATWTNQGTITVSEASTLQLGGGFTPAAIGTLSVSSDSRVNITGVMDNTHNTFNPANYDGTWGLDGGTIKGGTVALSDYTFYLQNPSFNGTSVTLGGVHAGSALIFDGETVQATDNVTITGTPASDRGAVSLLQIGGPSTYAWPQLTLGSNTLVHGALTITRDWVSGNSWWPCTLINNGTISADQAGQTLAINADTLTNNGTLQAANGGTLSIQDNSLFWVSSWTNTGTIKVDASSTLILGGIFTTAGLGTLQVSPGSTVDIKGCLDNAGATLSLGSYRNTWYLSQHGIGVNGRNYSAITDGTLIVGDTDGAATVILRDSAGVGVDYLTIGTHGAAGSVTVGNGAVLQTNTGDMNVGINGGNATLTNNGGYIQAAGNLNVGILGGHGTLAVNGGEVHADGDLQVGGTGGNGTLNVWNSATVTIAAGHTLNNAGQTTLDAGTAVYGNVTNTAGGTLTLNGSISGDLHNISGTVQGNGTLTGSFINDGLLAPGGLAPLTMYGDFTQTAAGTTLLRILDSSTFDTLSIGGQANLAGMLDVQFLNGFKPLNGQRYQFVTTGYGTNGVENLSLNIQGLPGYRYTVDTSGGLGVAFNAIPQFYWDSGTAHIGNFNDSTLWFDADHNPWNGTPDTGSIVVLAPWSAGTNAALGAVNITDNAQSLQLLADNVNVTLQLGNPQWDGSITPATYTIGELAIPGQTDILIGSAAVPGGKGYTSVFLQGAGSLVAGNAAIGGGDGNNAGLYLSSNTALTLTGNLDVGVNTGAPSTRAIGNLEIDGGLVAVGQTLRIGGQAGGLGGVTLDGTAGTPTLRAQNIVVGTALGSGALTVNAGTVTIGTANPDGTTTGGNLTVGSNGGTGNVYLLNLGSTLTATALTIGTGSSSLGQVDVSNYAALQAGTIVVGDAGSAGTLLVRDGASASTGTLTIGSSGGTGVLSVTNGGQLQVTTGSLAIGATGTMHLDNSQVAVAGTLANLGSMNIAGSSAITATVQNDSQMLLATGASLNLTGNLTQSATGQLQVPSGATLTLPANNLITNAGLATVEAGGAINSTVSNIGSGTLTLNGTLTGNLHNQSGTIQGAGTLNGTFTNDALFAPAATGFAINGDFTQSSTGTLAWAPVAGSISLDIQGHVTIAGQMTVDLTNYNSLAKIALLHFTDPAASIQLDQPLSVSNGNIPAGYAVHTFLTDSAGGGFYGLTFTRDLPYYWDSNGQAAAFSDPNPWFDAGHNPQYAAPDAATTAIFAPSVSGAGTAIGSVNITDNVQSLQMIADNVNVTFQLGTVQLDGSTTAATYTIGQLAPIGQTDILIGAAAAPGGNGYTSVFLQGAGSLAAGNCAIGGGDGNNAGLYLYGSTALALTANLDVGVNTGAPTTLALGNLEIDGALVTVGGNLRIGGNAGGIGGVTLDTSWGTPALSAANIVVGTDLGSGTLTVYGGSVTVGTANPDGTTTGGNLTVGANGGTGYVYLLNPGSTLTAQTITIGTGSTSVGQVDVSNYAAIQAGALTIGTTGTMHIDNSQVSVTGTLGNQGLLNVSGSSAITATVQNDGQMLLAAGASLNLTGDLTQSATGQLQVPSGATLTLPSGNVLTNAGQATVEAGGAINATVSNIGSGTLALNGTLTGDLHNHSGTVQGAGMLNGAFTNDALFAPAATGFTISGDFTQSSTGTLALAPVVGSLSLDIQGHVTIAGQMTVDMTNNNVLAKVALFHFTDPAASIQLDQPLSVSNWNLPSGYTAHAFQTDSTTGGVYGLTFIRDLPIYWDSNGQSATFSDPTQWYDAGHNLLNVAPDAGTVAIFGPSQQGGASLHTVSFMGDAQSLQLYVDNVDLTLQLAAPQADSTLQPCTYTVGGNAFTAQQDILVGTAAAAAGHTNTTTLTLLGGGTLAAGTAAIGGGAGATATVNMNAGTTLALTGTLDVGVNAGGPTTTSTGQLIVYAGSTVAVGGAVHVGANPGGNGALELAGAHLGTPTAPVPSLTIANGGLGMLSVYAASTANLGDVTLAANGGMGFLLLDGSSSLAATGTVLVGTDQGSRGYLTAHNQSTVTTNALTIGSNSGTGSVELYDHSSLTTNGPVTIGDNHGNGTLLISTGAAAQCAGVTIGSNGGTGLLRLNQCSLSVLNAPLTIAAGGQLDMIGAGIVVVHARLDPADPTRMLSTVDGPVLNQGLLTGYGFLYGTMQNDGGISVTSNATLHIYGDCTQSAAGTLALAPAFVTPSLDIHGHATIDGRIRVDLSNYHSTADLNLMQLTDPAAQITATLITSGVPAGYVLQPFQTGDVGGEIYGLHFAPSQTTFSCNTTNVIDTLQHVTIQSDSGGGVGHLLDSTVNHEVLDLHHDATGATNVGMTVPLGATLPAVLRVTFDYEFLTDGKLQILAGGNIVDTLFSATTPAGWNHFDETFAGLAGTPNVQFFLSNTGDPEVLLDNVSLDAPSVVPEPASLALLALGGAGLLLRRRRK